jgi:hypothetical protein
MPDARVLARWRPLRAVLPGHQADRDTASTIAAPVCPEYVRGLRHERKTERLTT